MGKKESTSFKVRRKKDEDPTSDYRIIELYQYKGKVVRVVDADTVDAAVDMGFGITMTQRFRINDWDAPETYRPRNEAEKKHGTEATERAIELLMDKEILLKSTKVAGIYGRFGATIWLEDGRDYAEVMINEGFTKKKDY